MFKDDMYERTRGAVGELYFLKMEETLGLYPINVYLDSGMKRKLGAMSIKYVNSNFKIIKPRKKSKRLSFRQWCQK